MSFVYNNIHKNTSIFQEHIKQSFNNASNNHSKLTNEIITISNMVGIKKLHFFNNLLEMEDSRYLQLGGWKGATVCSAMYNNHSIITCVHDWSEFGGPRNVFLNNINKCRGNNNVIFIENDPIKVNLNNIPKCNIYYSCNDPNMEATLQYYLPRLDTTFIYIASGWNWWYVRKDTYVMFSTLKLVVLFEMTIAPHNEIIKHWDSGLAVFVVTTTFV